MEYTDITQEQLQDARNWIDDRAWGDLDNAAELSDHEVYRGIAQHYYGGWEEFLVTNKVPQAARTLSPQNEEWLRVQLETGIDIRGTIFDGSIGAA